MKGAKKLSTLKVGIYREGKLVMVSEMPDPRQAYLESFNRPDRPEVAVPLSGLPGNRLRKLKKSG